MREVPEDLRKRYFELQGQRYVFRSDLRRSVIFGRNDLVQDAPISRIDLLLCRNTLMYFNAETQARVVNRFHFAMNDEGVLFLGKAEMLLAHGELFAPIDLKRRFFRKVARPLPNGRGLPLTTGLERVLEPATAGPLRAEALSASPLATLLLTPDGLLAFSNPRADAMFALSQRDVGRPFRDLEVSYRPVELRSSIDQALRERRTGWLREIEASRVPGDSLYLDIQIAPLIGITDEVLGVALYFHDVTRHHKLQAELELTNRQLETAYEELQSTVEELETTNEELQSTVEELETTNEELQSTNEELETMNEELQSTNDELQTINDELRDRTQDVHEANAFLEAIMSSLKTSVIVVDRDLVVRSWNRRSEDMWGLRADEAQGQHLLNLDIGLPTGELRPLLREALAGRVPESELRLSSVNRRGRTIAIRVGCAPLASASGEYSGAIVLVDEEP